MLEYKIVRGDTVTNRTSPLARDLISEQVTGYLRAVIESSQKYIKEYTKNSAYKYRVISLDDYNYLLESGKNKNEYFELRNYYDGYVELNSDDIEELLSLIYESLLTYDLSECAVTGSLSLLITLPLRNLQAEIDNKKKLSIDDLSKKYKLKKWSYIILGNKCCSILEDFLCGVCVSWIHDDEFAIYNDEADICRITVEGIDKLEEAEIKRKLDK